MRSTIPEERQIDVQRPAVALARVEGARSHAGAHGGAPVKLCLMAVPLHELVDIRGAHHATVPRRRHQRIILGRRHGGLSSGAVGLRARKQRGCRHRQVQPFLRYVPQHTPAEWSVVRDGHKKKNGKELFSSVPLEQCCIVDWKPPLRLSGLFFQPGRGVSDIKEHVGKD